MQTMPLFFSLFLIVVSDAYLKAQYVTFKVMSLYEME